LLSLIHGQAALGRTTGRWDELLNAQDGGAKDCINVVVWALPFVLAIYQPAPKRDCLAVLGDQFTNQADLIGVISLGMIQEHNSVESPELKFLDGHRLVPVILLPLPESRRTQHG
jgi:hypothetical protein